MASGARDKIPAKVITQLLIDQERLAELIALGLEQSDDLLDLALVEIEHVADQEHRQLLRSKAEVMRHEDDGLIAKGVGSLLRLNGALQGVLRNIRCLSPHEMDYREVGA